jgi:hypothetical protein
MQPDYWRYDARRRRRTYGILVPSLSFGEHARLVMAATITAFPR